MDMIKAIILLLVVAVKSSQISAQNARIVGGVAVSGNQFPSMGAIVTISTNSLICGATIVGARHFISSASCVLNITINGVVMIAGCNNFQSKSCRSYKIESALAHESYDPITGANDISIIRTKGCIQFTAAIQPLQVNFVDPAVGASCVFVGFGATSVADTSNNILYSLNVVTIDTATCNIPPMPPTLATNGALQICTSTTSTNTPCFRDLGGPLICNGVYIGTLSFTDCLGLPAIFTRIVPYVPWLFLHAY